MKHHSVATKEGKRSEEKGVLNNTNSKRYTIRPRRRTKGVQ